MRIDDLVFTTPSSEVKYEEYFMGADWARTSDGTSIVVFGRDNMGILHLVELVNLHNLEYAKQIAVAK